MLVLGRKEGEEIHIGDDIVITLVLSKEGKARIGIDAPDNIRVLRKEVKQRLEAEAEELRKKLEAEETVCDAKSIDEFLVEDPR